MSWHDALLPGDLRGRRSARDWAVDVVMWLIAVVVGVAVFADSAGRHSAVMALADLTLGLVSLAALWWRRSRPDRVGVLATAAAIVSACAAGPALIAGFNVALRGSRRGILAVVGLSAISAFASPRSIPPATPTPPTSSSARC
jgi:hypothetical protein